MAPQTIDGPNNRKGKLFRDGDRPVYVLDDGKFCVYWGGKFVMRPTLRGIDNVLRRSRKSVELFTLNQYYVTNGYNPRVFDVVEMTGRYVVDAGGKRHYVGGGDWFTYDAKIVAGLLALERKREKLEKELQAELKKLMKKAKKVYAEDVNETLKDTK